MLSKNYLNAIYNTLFLTFCFLVPFEDYASAIPNILLGVMGTLFPFIITKKRILELLKNKSFLLLIILLIYVFINSLFQSNFYKDLFVIRKMIIPFVIIILALPINNVVRIKQVFIVSTTIAILISLFNILNHFILVNKFEFSEGGFVNDLLVSERLYIGLCSVISLVFSLEIFKNTKKRSHQIIIISLCLLFVMFVYLIAARIAIISTVLVLIILMLNNFNWKQNLIGSISVILFSILFFFMNQNLTERFLRSDDIYRKTFYEKIKTHEPRFVIWNCTLEILKENENLLFGTGFENSQKKLINCYKANIVLDHKRKWFVDSEFNTHNQFLSFIMGSGIIGLFLFLSVLYFLIVDSKNNFQIFSLISVLVLFIMVENIFHRQIGNYLFALIFIITQNKLFKRNLTK